MSEANAKVDPRLRRARLSVFGVFIANGFLLSMWVVNIPAVQARTDVSHGTLGALLLVLGAGALLGMQIAGPLSDRIGSKLTVIGALAALSIAVTFPGFAVDAVSLGAGLFLFGMFNGAVDVAMNAHAAAVECAYRRPIMSAFHALFSIGGVAGALLGAGLIGAGVPLPGILLGAAALGALLLAGSTPGMLSRAAETAAATPAQTEPAQIEEQPTAAPGADSPNTATAPQPSRSKRVGLSKTGWMLGVTAFLLMLTEGVANDWSALQIANHLDAPESLAALGYAAFSVTMTAGRLAADWIVVRIGPVAVVRYGALIGALGLAIITTSGWLWLTLAGWAILGIGLSGCVPQIFTAAGNLRSGARGMNMSRVVGMGYIGLLSGPALVGWIAEYTTLNTALLAPLLFCLAVPMLAVSLRPDADGPPSASALPAESAALDKSAGRAPEAEAQPRD
ncbi:MFS transporter [Actinoalloteichus hymeniacidonis]|uniref:Fucose permease n=1 Tax=Actinoalloteichus hymeniacidonis TaxID=340345 RepID=A0AAC9MZI2_9PSEU|nr:MFS transporter [Actinoalloteichus hymeniacidonis]AOS64097.1 fucose permease [Actinoalloteichus hymeniacidonis]MBB5907839.1 MFS family permease [Actinoalloteichus hymeniacidonis]